jgi:hypothetical protein
MKRMTNPRQWRINLGWWRKEKETESAAKGEKNGRTRKADKGMVRFSNALATGSGAPPKFCFHGRRNAFVNTGK